ncbi:hypothetical protein CM49_05842 [Paenibacillus sp. P1XP2]|nr:hypothetical protein CM49_05842 [Paenibacillus sp. P1XP2]
MSIEIVLIPVAIALTKEIAERVSKHLETKGEAGCMIIETRMKDETLLSQALEEWSCSFRKVESIDHFELGKENEVAFLVDEEGCFSLVLPESANREAFTEWVEKVERSYNHYLQQSVYRNLLERAKEQGMILEVEEVLDDNSIQVTYILNDKLER